MGSLNQTSHTCTAVTTVKCKPNSLTRNTTAVLTVIYKSVYYYTEPRLNNVHVPDMILDVMVQTSKQPNHVVLLMCSLLTSDDFTRE